jgi:hypothetical protein
MIEAAIASTIVSGIAGAGMSLVSGFQAAHGARAERRQYEREREVSSLQGDEAVIQHRLNLERVLAANQALRAGRGLSLMSGTAEAIRDRNIAEAAADIGAARLNAANRDLRNSYAIAASRQREEAGLLAGAAGAIRGLSSASPGLSRLGTLIK